MWERLNCGGMGGPSWAPMGRPWVVGWVGGGGGDGGAEEFGADPANTWHGPSSCQDAVRSKKRIYCRSCKHLGRPTILRCETGPMGTWDQSQADNRIHRRSCRNPGKAHHAGMLFGFSGVLRILNSTTCKQVVTLAQKQAISMKSG